ncbi:putative Zn(II)2Cys6 transcription factor [Aspergillus granulosus]|uniref:Zn(II)2Cys6 transcription factor n=1 Tax=Aspergillus granulosus TaxID=176169 RepID=A0ABR4H440_9EURO
MSDTESLHKIRSRRSHRKSRLGCGNCKKRRIKCDEQKPTCSNCLHHSIDCDFTARSDSEKSTPPARRYQFRQSKYQQSPSPRAPDDSPSSSNSIAVQCDIPPIPDKGGISLSDLHLFHHYTIATYHTLSNDPTPITQRLWQCRIPAWGISFPSILHLILALAALHLASLHPDQREKYTVQADQHFTFGVRSVTSVLRLDTLDSENCQLIYMSAVLICFVYFARGPRDGEFLVFSAGGKSEWLVLLHGVRTILAQKQGEIFRGDLEPAAKERNLSAADPHSVSTLEEELSQHLDRLHAIRALAASEVGVDRDVYISAVDDLLNCFQDAYENRKAGVYGAELMPSTMGWTFRLSEVMIDRLEGREPVALVILAHWAILLRYMRDVWFMRGWDGHIIRGIQACLPGEFLQWIEWPGLIISS